MYESTETIRYDFLRWVDESTDLVEISKDTEILQVRYPIDTQYIGVGVPLWIDTSWSDTWTNGMNISLGGLTLKVSRTTRGVEAGDFACWYLSTQSGFSTQRTYYVYYYDVNLGFLVIYVKTTTMDFSFSQQVYELADTNLKDFMFLGGVLNSPLITALLSVGIGLEVVIIIILYFRRMKNR